MEIAGATLYALVLLVVGCGVALAVAQGSRVAGHVVAVFGASFGLRVSLIFFNGVLEVLPEKDAGGVALDLFRLSGLGTRHMDWSGVVVSNFALQMLLDAPGFLLFGDSMWVLRLTNAFIGAIAAVLAFAYARALAGPRAAVMALWLFSLYPALINFSFFGLRDPGIFLFLTVFAGSSMLALRGGGGGKALLHGGVALVALGAVLVQRLELLPIALILPMWILLRRAWEMRKVIRQGPDRWVLGGLLLLIVVAAGVPIGQRVYETTIGQVNAVGVSPMEFVDLYTARRYFGASGADSGESNILPPSVYTRLPTVVRIVAQTLGMIILPFPWLWTSPSRLLALGDSIFVVACFWLAFRWMRAEPEGSRRLAIEACLVTCAVGFLIMGFVVINAGNAFRMRVSLMPFGLLAAAMAYRRPGGPPTPPPGSLVVGAPGL